MPAALRVPVMECYELPNYSGYGFFPELFSYLG